MNVSCGEAVSFGAIHDSRLGHCSALDNIAWDAAISSVYAATMRGKMSCLTLKMSTPNIAAPSLN
jgi:hypothetical protein